MEFCRGSLALCARCESASSCTPLTASTPWRCHPMCWPGSLTERHPIRPVSATSPTFAPAADGCIWRPCWTCIRAKFWVGQWPLRCPQCWCARLCKWLFNQRNPAAGLVVHSDRGTQYASAQHQGLLQKHGLVGNMSRKGNCWDNSAMERFFLNLKMERVWQKDYAKHSEAMTDVTDYIVGFYNTARLHSKLGNLSPNAFERQSATQLPIDVSEIT